MEEKGGVEETTARGRWGYRSNGNDAEGRAEDDVAPVELGFFSLGTERDE